LAGPLRVRWLGRVAYDEALALQRGLFDGQRSASCGRFAKRRASDAKGPGTSRQDGHELVRQHRPGRAAGERRLADSRRSEEGNSLAPALEPGGMKHETALQGKPAGEGRAQRGHETHGRRVAPEDPGLSPKRIDLGPERSMLEEAEVVRPGDPSGRGGGGTNRRSRPQLDPEGREIARVKAL
jgi:hypothetical protein